MPGMVVVGVAVGTAADGIMLAGMAVAGVEVSMLALFFTPTPIIVLVDGSEVTGKADIGSRHTEPVGISA